MRESVCYSLVMQEPFTYECSVSLQLATISLLIPQQNICVFIQKYAKLSMADCPLLKTHDLKFYSGFSCLPFGDEFQIKQNSMFDETEVP